MTRSFRRSSLVALAAIVVAAVGFSVTLAHAKPAQAVGAACYFSDAEGTVYDDGYASSGPWTVGYPGNFHNGYTDIKAWRYSDPGNHHCYRGYYTSTWTGDQSDLGGQLGVVAALRVWVCGQWAGEGQSGYTPTWRMSITSYNWTGAGGSAQWIWVNDVWPSGGNVFFLDYTQGGTTCGRQMDNLNSSAYCTACSNGIVVNTEQAAGYLNNDRF